MTTSCSQGTPSISIDPNEKAVIFMAPSPDFSLSAFFRCDRVHVAHEPIDIGAIAVRAVDDGGLVIGDGLRELERLLAVAAVELVDRHGILPRTVLIYASDHGCPVP
jgi:hypothetical protein